MSFGSRLKQLRLEKGLSQDALGKGLGTDGKDAGKQVVTGWESGKHYPRVDQLALICKRLDCSADFLVLETAVSSAKLTPEIAQLAAQIDKLDEDDRRYVLRMCNESIQFVHKRNGGVGAPDQEQQIR